MIDPGSGSRTGNPLIDNYISGYSAAGGMSPPQGAQGQQPRSPFDDYRMYFMAPNPPIVSPAQRRAGGRRPKGGRPGLNQTQSFWSPDRQAQRDQLKTQQGAVQQRDSDRKKLISLAKRAGLIGNDYLPSELDLIWQQAIDEAEASSAMGTRVTPWQILEHWAKDPKAARGYAKPGASAPDLEQLLPPEKRTVTSTHTSTQITDPKTARAVVLSGLKSVLGRAPTKAEEKHFRDYLNSLERENPTVTTTTQQYEGGDLQSSTSETTGGAPTPAAALETFTDEEFGEEAYAYSLARDGDWLLKALTGSIV